MDREPANQGGPAAGASTAPSRPSAVDWASLEVELVGPPVRDKAHTDEGEAIAAPRRRLPMAEVKVEVNAHLTLTGPDGPIARLDAVEGRGHGL